MTKLNYDVPGLIDTTELTKKALEAHRATTTAMHATMNALSGMAVAHGAEPCQCQWVQHPTEYESGLGDFSDEIERYELQVDDEVWAIMRVERRATRDPFVLNTVITKEWIQSVSE